MKRIFSDEWRKKLSIAHKGKIPWNKGKKLVSIEMSKEKRRAYRKLWNIRNKDKIFKVARIWRKRNREKLATCARLRYQRNPQEELDRVRFKKYGITGEEYREIILRQGIKCPICNKDITNNPSVDHNHATGKIRGFICNKCNLAIGNAEDSPDRLRAMASYLERTNA